MASEVRIKVTAETAEAQKDLKQLDKKVTTTKGTVGGLSEGFGQLTKNLAVLGVGTLGFGALLGGTIKIIQSAAKEGAQLDFVMGLLPDSLKQAFTEMEPKFKGLARLFDVTEEDVAIAFATLLRDTRRSNITFEELAGTLGFVAREGLDAQEAAVLVAAALNGDIAAIKRVTGFWAGLTEALRKSAETGAEATTVFSNFSAAAERDAKNLGRALDALSEGDFVGFVEEVKRLGVGWLDDFINETPGLQAALTVAKDSFGAVKDAVGEFFDAVVDGVTGPEESVAGLGLVMGEVGTLTDENQAFRDYLAGLTGDLGTALTAAELLRAELASPFPTGFPSPTGLEGGTFTPFADQAIDAGFDPAPIVPTQGATAPDLVVPTTPDRIFPPPFSGTGLIQPGSGGDDDPFFDDGGIVGGAPGTHQRIIAKAGERVLTEPQQAAMMGTVNNTLIVEGDVVVDSEVRFDSFVRKVQENMTTLARGGQSI